MKPANFLYCCPETLEDIISILHTEKENGKLLAGGQSLVAMLNMRLVYPKVVIDIKNVESFYDIKETSEGLWVGANVTQQKLLEYKNLSKIAPLLYKILPWVGHYQTRTKGTICGSIAHADPSSELPLCLALLRGKVSLQSKKQKRLIAANEFQQGMLSTICKPDEIIDSVFFPKLENNLGVAFNEFTLRYGDFSLLSVAAIYHENEIKVGVTGLSDKPYITTFPILSKDDLDDALNDLAWKLKGLDDHVASAKYRRNLLREIGKITINEARNAKKNAE
jgi:2-furoyl-CoA dehydrogenase FAD binding subunit